ncbi:MAG: hypothetical protein ACR2KZ_21265, partial [Segetibacter sp.]
YIERGFKYKRHSYKETQSLTKNNFPYQLSFNYKPNQNLTIFIRESELNKFDSSNANWGYLKKPELSDTIILGIGGENVKSGLIKVW